MIGLSKSKEKHGHEDRPNPAKYMYTVYPSLKRTKIAPEHGWLEDEFPFCGQFGPFIEVPNGNNIGGVCTS